MAAAIFVAMALAGIPLWRAANHLEDRTVLRRFIKCCVVTGYLSLVLIILASAFLLGFMLGMTV